jgi:putative ABC transport system permease protein
MLNDLRFALRMLLKSPGFTAVAVFTLALGIGANTAIFSAVNAVLLRALPYHDPEHVVMLWTDNPSSDVGFHELPPTPTDLIAWRSQTQSFDQIASFKVAWADLSDQGDPERVGAIRVTANLFPLLGLQIMLGRTFMLEEEQPGQNKVAIISHALWRRRYGGDPALVGRTITCNRERLIVVGIMPPGVDFPHGTEMPSAYGMASRTDVWVPFAEDSKYWQRDDTREFITMGRLKPGVTLAQAQSEMTNIAQRRAQEFPATHAGWTVHLRPLALQVAGKTRPVLFILLGAVGFVLLIACANVANLLLCRSAGRRKEVAVRAAIGAGRGRIIRQLLAESVVLSALGGAIGLLLGAWGVRVILALSPPNIPRLHETTLDGHVLLFTAVISLATGIVFGLAPAWYASRVNLSEALNAEGRSGTATGRHRTHGVLVIAEVALAVILLVGAGLMIQSFLRLQAVDPGFNPQSVVAFDVALFGAKYDNAARQRQFFRQARTQLTSLSGVHSAAAVTYLPLGEAKGYDKFFIEGAPASPPGKEPLTEKSEITPGYFETMGIILLRGRDFNDQDTGEKPMVCIINETISHNFFPGTDPLGKRLKVYSTGEDIPWRTIVGVARSVRGYSLEAEPLPVLYLPNE